MKIDDLTAEDMREDASEEDKRLAADIRAGKVVWCGQCDEWVLPEEMRSDPGMCIDCLVENEFEDPEMKEENR
jgi:hypothetical protein